MIYIKPLISIAKVMYLDIISSSQNIFGFPLWSITARNVTENNAQNLATKLNVLVVTQGTTYALIE